MNRLVYIGYYFRKMNWSMLRRFMRHTSTESGISSTGQVFRFMKDSLRYNISPLEWYQFGFARLSSSEKASWAGTGTMYEFQRRMNPPAEREILNDKRAFYRAYREFFRHPLWALEELENDSSLAKRLLQDHERLVFKDATGNCGTGVRVQPTAELDGSDLPGWMGRQGFDMVEGFVEQHPDVSALSPSGVNTVRIFTLINDNDEYSVLGCRLRISVDSQVDNLAAGNLAAPIDEATGVVCGPGVYSDITRKPETVHPVTGAAINGFQVPFWPETLDLVKKASLKHPQNRSIGWDVAITESGPGLIEGNHDWCKLVWQLPVGRGLKDLLSQA